MSNAANLMDHLTLGRVYRRETLLPYTKTVDRDLQSLSKTGALKKVAPGLYYYPKLSRFGELPPSDYDVVNTFLKNDPFLLFTWNDYNSLQLGLTQLYNKVIVYNRKRHETLRLGNKLFDFRRPTKGFPSELSKEFLLVDLLNNLPELVDDPEEVKNHVKKRLPFFNHDKLKELAKNYGKISTYKFLQRILN